MPLTASISVFVLVRISRNRALDYRRLREERDKEKSPTSGERHFDKRNSTTITPAAAAVTQFVNAHRERPIEWTD